MSVRKAIADLYSRLRGTWVIDDPRPIAARAPYTYFLPSEAVIEAVQPGDLVKASFRPVPPNRDWDAERMWARVVSVAGETLHCTLESSPYDIPQLRIGAAVQVPRTHIIDVIWADRQPGPVDPPIREFWDRCYVDSCVVDGRSHVDYLYREEPDEMADQDAYPDSGWRIRGRPEAIEDDESNGLTPHYIAIGAVLNVDDRWLHLIDEPAGWAYQWSEGQKDYIRNRLGDEGEA